MTMNSFTFNEVMAFPPPVRVIFHRCYLHLFSHAGHEDILHTTVGVRIREGKIEGVRKCEGESRKGRIK